MLICRFRGSPVLAFLLHLDYFRAVVALQQPPTEPSELAETTKSPEPLALDADETVSQPETKLQPDDMDVDTKKVLTQPSASEWKFFAAHLLKEKRDMQVEIQSQSEEIAKLKETVEEEQRRFVKCNETSSRLTDEKAKLYRTIQKLSRYQADERVLPDNEEISDGALRAGRAHKQGGKSLHRSKKADDDTPGSSNYWPQISKSSTGNTAWPGFGGWPQFGAWPQTGAWPQAGMQPGGWPQAGAQPQVAAGSQNGFNPYTATPWNQQPAAGAQQGRGAWGQPPENSQGRHNDDYYMSTTFRHPPEGVSPDW